MPLYPFYRLQGELLHCFFCRATSVSDNSSHHIVQRTLYERHGGHTCDCSSTLCPYMPQSCPIVSPTFLLYQMLLHCAHTP